MKKFAFILLVAFATMSFTSVEILKSSEEDPDCSTVFTICNTGFPIDYDAFAQCMINNGCGG